ncbi:MAG: hypothetical protein PHX80_05345 [Candidatus Nanoarchaeia archaeon]|nr:hypothetical protein [Candidatus Nanoarchaeia archaeon]
MSTIYQQKYSLTDKRVIEIFEAMSKMEDFEQNLLPKEMIDNICYQCNIIKLNEKEAIKELVWESLFILSKN